MKHYELSDTHKIMVIDDDDDLVEYVSAILKDGMEANTLNFSDPNKALDALKTASEVNCGVDAIVCDIHMPEMSGHDFLLELRSANINIPVVFLSGHLDVEALTRALRLGAFDVIEKPPEISVLVQTVTVAARIGESKRRATILSREIQEALKPESLSFDQGQKIKLNLKEIDMMQRSIELLSLRNHASKS